MQYATSNQQYYQQLPYSQQQPYAQQAYQYGQRYYQQQSQNPYPQQLATPYAQQQALQQNPYQPQQQQPQPQPAMTQYANGNPVSYTTPHFATPEPQHAQVPTSHRPPPRQQTPHPHRRNTTTGATTASTRPLKSALKRSAEVRTNTTAFPVSPAAPVALQRSRTHSGGAENSRPRLNSMTRSRSRTESMNRTNPDHIFLSLRGTNELVVCNIAYQSTMEELKEKIPPIWPGGATTEPADTDTEWRVRFAGSPWSATGQEAVLAQRIIIRVFWILSNQGYVYLTSINTGNAFKPTQLVFIRARPDPEAVFFTMTVNARGTQVRFVDLPRGLADQIGIPLRYQFPHFIREDKTVEDGGYYISLNQTLSSGAVNKELFLAAILKALNDLAFKLDASVPLSRTGILGLGSRKEVWVFKGSPSWWPQTS